MSRIVLSLKNIDKYYAQGGERVDVLRGVNLDVAAGELVAITGESGSGKSSLLHIAGLLDRPASGQVRIMTKSGKEFSFNKKTNHIARRRHIGFVYQMHNLLPDFSALENVSLPLILLGEGQQEAKSKAAKLLGSMGIEDKKDSLAGEMSGGQAQRVAVARSMICRPDILIADEPTGSLDSKTAGIVFDLLLKLTRQNNTAILMATHNASLAAKMNKIYEIKDKKILSVSS